MPAPSPAPASVPSPGRRALLAATAWGVPAVSLTVASPAHALSGDSVTARLAQSRVQPGDVTTLTATLVDGQGAPVSGRGVAVSPSVDGITANPASGATDAQGEFSSRITVGTEVPVGDHAISVSTASGGTSTVLSVAGALLLTLSSTRLRSDAEVTARVRLLDTQGQPAAGQSITFEGAGAAVFADRLLQTDADGSAQTFLRGDRTQAPGRFTVRAYDENGDSDSVDVVVVAPVELTIDPVSVERGATARAQVFAYDARANPEAGRTISISVMEVVDGTSRASTWITADPSSVTTGSDGRAVVDLVAASDAPAKSYTVTASDGNDSASAALEVLAPAVPLTVVLAPSLVPWGGSSRVSVTVTNSDHTRVADADVTIGWASDDLSVSPTSGRTDQNGVFAAVAQVSAAPASSGSRRITATTGASRGDADLVIDAVRQRLTDFARPSQVVVTDSTAWVLDGDRLSMFDTSSRTSTRAVTLPATCRRIAASSRHDPAWIYLATGDGRVFVYDVAVGAISSTIRRPGTSRDATQIAVHDTAARAYVTLPRDGAVMVIDTGTNTYLTSIGVSWPVGVAGGRGSFRTLFYVVDGDGVLHSRDAADNTQRSTLELGAPTDLTAPMVVDAEGERAYIVASDGESTRLVVVDLRGWQVLARVDLGSARPGGVALSPTGDRLFISTISPALITDVSCRTYEVRKTLNAGDAPSSIAVQDASTAYVTNYSTTQPGVSVIDVR